MTCLSFQDVFFFCLCLFYFVSIPAVSVAHWEQLQQEKEELERRFESELQGLRAQQQKELGALEERLKAQHVDETNSLQALQRAELEELHFKQQEQVCARQPGYELPCLSKSHMRSESAI